jgi:hypothetical protein
VALNLSDDEVTIIPFEWRPIVSSYENNLAPQWNANGYTLRPWEAVVAKV